jgi:hypothetical protein
LWIVRVSDGAQVRLVKGIAPAWSPDGRQIAYVGSGGAVKVVSAGGGRPRGLRAVRGTSLDWQPLPARGKPGCVPKGSTALVSSPDAVVFQRGYSIYGCLRALGQARLISNGCGIRGAVRLAGRFAALDVLCLAKGGLQQVEMEMLYDLGNGNGTVLWSLFPVPAQPSLDSLVLDSSGFAAWRATSQEPRSREIRALTCPSSSVCVAGDDAGNILTSTDPTGGASSWNTAGVSISGISCPSASFCVAINGDGVLASTDPTGGASAWTSTTIGPHFLTGISCPSTSLCVAGDGFNDIMTSTDPAGGPNAWTTAHLRNPLVGAVPIGPIGPISCPSTSLCVAAQSLPGGILTSTNPTGGASSWSFIPAPGVAPFPAGANSSVNGISCPSVSLCVALVNGGDVFTSSDPTAGAGAWTMATTDPGNGLASVSCPSAQLCIAVDGQGSVLTSTNPTGGAGAWSTAHISSNALSTVSCPSAALCVVGDANGNILTSTNPTGGAGTWTNAAVDIPPCTQQSTPCISEQLYARDDQGTRVVDTSPPGFGHSIGNVSLAGDSLVLSWSHDGRQRQLDLR